VPTHTPRGVPHPRGDHRGSPIRRGWAVVGKAGLRTRSRGPFNPAGVGSLRAAGRHCPACRTGGAGQHPSRPHRPARPGARTDHRSGLGHAGGPSADHQPVRPRRGTAGLRLAPHLWPLPPAGPVRSRRRSPHPAGRGPARGAFQRWHRHDGGDGGDDGPCRDDAPPGGGDRPGGGAVLPAGFPFHWRVGGVYDRIQHQFQRRLRRAAGAGGDAGGDEPPPGAGGADNGGGHRGDVRPGQGDRGLRARRGGRGGHDAEDDGVWSGDPGGAGSGHSGGNAARCPHNTSTGSTPTRHPGGTLYAYLSTCTQLAPISCALRASPLSAVHI